MCLYIWQQETMYIYLHKNKMKSLDCPTTEPRGFYFLSILYQIGRFFSIKIKIDIWSLFHSTDSMILFFKWLLKFLE